MNDRAAGDKNNKQQILSLEYYYLSGRPSNRPHVSFDLKWLED
jgi:hypothetical protein